MRIACDMDGVMVSLLDEWLAAYHDAGGELLSAADIPEYNWENYVADKQLFVRILKSAGIFASAKPMPDALAGLLRLRSEHDVYFVTTVYGTRATDAKLGWLYRYVRPQVRTEDVIFCRRKELVDADILIEDAPKNLEKWLAAHPHGRGFLVSHAYNAAFSHPRVIRVASVLEAALLLEQL